MENTTIRRSAAANGVFLWQIAERLGISDANFSRKLRRELPADEQSKILEIIGIIAKEAENAGN